MPKEGRGPTQPQATRPAPGDGGEEGRGEGKQVPTLSPRGFRHGPTPSIEDDTVPPAHRGSEGKYGVKQAGMLLHPLKPLLVLHVVYNCRLKLWQVPHPHMDLCIPRIQFALQKAACLAFAKVGLVSARPAILRHAARGHRAAEAADGPGGKLGA